MIETLWLYWLEFFGIILVRYFFIAGVAYWFFSSMGKRYIRRELRLKPARWKSIWQDIELSVLSTVLFACCAALIMSGYDLGMTRLYTSIHQYGLWYLGVSFVAILLLQDAYFYFIHRAFHHHPWLFQWLHQGHHRSGDPTPWTSFAFDPLEALVQALFLVGIVFIIPLHFTTLIAVLLTMTLWTVWNHLGVELLPASFPRHWLGRWFIGPTHHAIHHRKYRVHYGLYFTFWDKLFGTHDPNYENEFGSHGAAEGKHS